MASEQQTGVPRKPGERQGGEASPTAREEQAEIDAENPQSEVADSEDYLQRNAGDSDTARRAVGAPTSDDPDNLGRSADKP